MTETREVQSLPTMLVTRMAPDSIKFDITADIVLWLDDHAARQLAEKLIILTQTPDRVVKR